MSPGTNPRWIDKDKGYPKKNAQFPTEVTDAVIKARDIGVPASVLEAAIRRVIETHLAA